MKESDLLKLAFCYTKQDHMLLLPKGENNVLRNLEFIYDPLWVSIEQAPYEVLTYLFDCYYNLPERPDLASLFCWQAINSSYNDLLIAGNVGRLQDSIGIREIISRILGNIPKYYTPLHDYIVKLDDKIFRYVARYLLKGYVCVQNNIQNNIIPSVYKTMTTNIPVLRDILSNSYGEAYKSITRPLIDPVTNRLKLNIQMSDKTLSIQIVKGFATELKKLLNSHSINLSDFRTCVSRTYVIDKEQELTFVMFGILYASRCNNFHGNVPSRLNTKYANVESYNSYLNIFLVGYFVLAISLNSQGKLSDDNLNRIYQNIVLML